MFFRIVRAAIVGADERDVEQERDFVRREEVVAVLPGEDRAKPRRHAERVVEAAERPAFVFQEARKAQRCRDEIAQANGRRHPIELAPDGHNDVEVPANRRRVVREGANQTVAKFLEAVRDAMALAADDDVIEAFGVEPLEADLRVEPRAAQELAHRLAFAAAEDVVNLRAEAILADRERVRVAAGYVVRLDNEHAAATSRGEQRGRREAAHPGADHEIVEVAHARILHAVRARRRAA